MFRLSVDTFNIHHTLDFSSVVVTGRLKYVSNAFSSLNKMTKERKYEQNLHNFNNYRQLYFIEETNNINRYHLRRI